MKLKHPVIRILKKIKTDDGLSAFDALIFHLLNVDKLSVKEISSLLEISVASVYAAKRKNLISSTQ